MNLMLPIFALWIVTPAPPVVDYKKLLAAIAQVESADATHPEGNDAAVGSHGERGRYQIGRHLWESISTKPFTFAHDQQCAFLVAKRHLEWAERKIRRAGTLKAPMAFLLALEWHSGMHAVFQSTLNHEQMSFATRVLNLYESN